jgi:hypothetical protein
MICIEFDMNQRLTRRAPASYYQPRSKESKPMNRTRHSRYLAALIALISMLFMQLAMASYACPDLRIAQKQPGASDTSAVMAAHQDMSDCQGADKVTPNLCQAQDQAGSQSLDTPHVPQVPAFTAIGLALPVLFLASAYQPPVVQPDAASLTRSTAPPLSIRNCCFRI